MFGTTNFAAAAPVLVAVRISANLKKGFEPDFSKKSQGLGHKIAAFHNGAAFVSGEEDYFAHMYMGTEKQGFSNISYVYNNGDVVTQSKDAIRNFALDITGNTANFHKELAMIQSGDLSPLYDWGITPGMNPAEQLQQAYWAFSEELVGKLKLKFNQLPGDVGEELVENYDDYRSITFEFPVNQEFPFHEETNTAYTYININVVDVKVNLGKTVVFSGQKFGGLFAKAAAATAQAQSLDVGTVFADPRSVVQGAKAQAMQKLSKTQKKKQLKRAESEARKLANPDFVKPTPPTVERKEEPTIAPAKAEEVEETAVTPAADDESNIDVDLPLGKSFDESMFVDSEEGEDDSSSDDDGFDKVYKAMF